MQQRGADLQSVGDLAHAVVEHRVAGDPQHAVLLTVPPQGEADHVADDEMARRRSVAARRGGDVDRSAGRAPRAASTSHGSSPRALPPSRCAPATVVTTTSAAGSNARPASSRLSAWWSWVSSTASIGPSSPARDGRSGHLARRRAPAEAVLPAGLVERRVGEQAPPADLDQCRRPADVRDADVRHASTLAWLDRPFEGVVGDLLPAGLGRQQMCHALVLLHLGQRVLRLVVLGVRPLDRRRHQVVLAAGDEQQRRPLVVLVVDPVVVVAGVDVRQRAAPEDAARRRDVVALVQRQRLLLAERVGERVVPLLGREARPPCGGWPGSSTPGTSPGPATAAPASRPRSGPS